MKKYLNWVICICLSFVVLAIAAQPLFSRLTVDGCGTPRERLGDIARGYRPVGTWAEMTRLVDESVASWKAEFSDPYRAWCESKIDRLRQNVRIKAWTMSEVDRNTEHYLFARQLVSERDSRPLRGVFFVSSILATGVYSVGKVVWSDQGSPPTWAEPYQAFRGAWHGLWDEWP